MAGPIMTTSANVAHLQQALATQPDLAISGFRHRTRKGQFPSTDAEFAEHRAQFFQPECLRQIETACRYYREFGIDKRDGSYGLKHRIERWGQSRPGLVGYVTNGCAILAAVMCGYKPVRWKDSPNCRFKKNYRPPEHQNWNHSAPPANSPHRLLRQAQGDSKSLDGKGFIFTVIIAESPR